VVHSPEQLAMIEAAQLPRPIRAWLKLDTGMNRLGFPPEGARAAAGRLGACPQVAPGVRLMTHLACADERDARVTDAQLERFAAALGDLPGERSIANSAGLLWRRDSHADWVRPGIMLYGVSPFADSTAHELGLRPAMDLMSTVIACARCIGASGSATAAYGRPARTAGSPLPQSAMATVTRVVSAAGPRCWYAVGARHWRDVSRWT
jgi:alanine racemase